MDPVAAIFCMPQRGHLQRLLPLITGLACRGVDVRVFTDAGFRAPVERAGGRLVEVFQRYSLDEADATSRPVPCRYVSFAAHYAAPLVDEVARLRPSLIVYDTFALIGFVLGRQLGIPYVNVCAGHNMSPARAIASLERDPRVAPSDACRRAVDALRDRWGLPDASPFSYFTGLSPFLNVYCEPPEFLRPGESAAFEPIAFFGSVPPPEMVRDSPAPGEPRLGDRSDANLSVYASFGTVVWRYYEADALQALAALSDALEGLDQARVLISLGNHPLRPAARARLERKNVRVADCVNQWSVLQGASVYVTHHGMKSTHEAIYHRVPMISYPFLDDQPGLAGRCQELGLAIPLVKTPRGSVCESDVRAALARLTEQSAHMAASLARARAWEIEVMNGRDAVIQRILDLL